MRIVQLSDIHLSSANKEILTAYYLESLLEDLKSYHNEKLIDIILLTGDLVDQGGSSLKKDPYNVFRDLFIDPLIRGLDIKSSQILFIPGNHDVQREYIDTADEFYLTEHLTTKFANELLNKQRSKFTKSNKRIKKFKTFEKNFHSTTDNYDFSNNESLVIVNADNEKVGFALINDSWRSSSLLKQNQHFIGTNQLLNARNFFVKHKTSLNIAVFHHPLEIINPSEREEIEGIIQSLGFDIAFFGHSHKYHYASILGSNGDIVTINGRSALNDPSETQSKYQPGYNILDIDVKNKSFVINARKYIHGQYRFDKDIEFFKDGLMVGTLNRSAHTSLAGSAKLQENNLPTSYSADEKKIVRLLIGKSLYPNQYIFARELIQNSVDACNRRKDKHTGLTPKITIRVSSIENSFEVIDEGDGMSKKVLLEHFSVIGKSISQEFSDSINGINLISQFGIGFISTFIVAQKVYVRTKSEEDDLINFEIEDVFKGFNYNQSPSLGNLTPNSTGTSIKVFLKTNYSAIEAFNQTRNFCRHVDNIVYYLDGMMYANQDSWNTENGTYVHELKNDKFTCKLTISSASRYLFASNSGFLININPFQIIPPRFPSIIGGEVNFSPKSIDFDLSRTNIMETSKALDFKKDISVSLRFLFRKIIDSKEPETYSTVVNYLLYYLSHYSENELLMTHNYLDFYTKKELIDLCAKSLNIFYGNVSLPLIEIIYKLKSLDINTIYFQNQNVKSELNSIVYNYLQETNNLVVSRDVISVQFRENTINFSITDAIAIIASDYGINVADIDSVAESQIAKLTTNKPEIKPKIAEMIKRISGISNRRIDVARLGVSFRIVLRFGDHIILNYDHVSFKNLNLSSENIDEKSIEFYLLGMISNEMPVFFGKKPE